MNSNCSYKINRGHRSVQVTAVIVCLTVVVYAGCDLLSKPRQGKKINERWESSNRSLKIRVTSYAEENGGLVPGAYYVFEATRADSTNWQEVMTVRHDDPVPIPKDQIRFVNDDLAYFFMVYKYAITTDGARSWVVRDIVTDLPDWQQYRPSIKDIVISPDGSGKMELTSSTNRPAAPLLTRDYGRHWEAE